MSRIAILGYGTVGGGIAQVLDVNAAEVTASAGEDITLGAILDLRDFPGDPHEAQVVHDIERILEDPDIEVVCETMGGVEPAYTYSRQILEAGKSVCTSNKELVAAHGPELVSMARERGLSYLFEASVGGGIPVLRGINGALRHEKLKGAAGILNGTTNYILTRMERDGLPFDKALADAQARGYAERDPAADIEGHDARRKIAILASLVSGRFVDSAAIPTEGISAVTAEDMREARERGYTIKLLGVCECGTVGVTAMVAPFLVPEDDPLSAVSGVYNAIEIEGNMVGRVMYYGRGAGREATASAVVADVIDIVRHRGQHIPVRLTDEAAELASADDRYERLELSSGNSYRVYRA